MNTPVTNGIINIIDFLVLNSMNNCSILLNKWIIVIHNDVLIIKINLSPFIKIEKVPVNKINPK
ncbi:MAG: hypothetical protein WHS65_14075 [Melioribacteraceae bacterium]